MKKLKEAEAEIARLQKVVRDFEDIMEENSEQIDDLRDEIWAVKARAFDYIVERG